MIESEIGMLGISQRKEPACCDFDKDNAEIIFDTRKVIKDSLRWTIYLITIYRAHKRNLVHSKREVSRRRERSHNSDPKV